MLSSSKTDTISPQLIEGLLAPVPGVLLELLADDGLVRLELARGAPPRGREDAQARRAPSARTPVRVRLPLPEAKGPRLPRRDG